MDKLRCNEIEIFEACVAWAKSSCQMNGLDENNSDNLKKELDDCFYLIRFGAMSMKEIGVILTNELNEDLLSKQELADIWRARSFGKLTSDLFKQAPRNFEWNGYSILDCIRMDSGNADIQIQESTWLSTNAPIFLGGKITFV